MNCSECIDDLVAYLEGLLGPEEKAQVQAHLQSCGACRIQCDAFAQLQQRLINTGQACQNSKST